MNLVPALTVIDVSKTFATTTALASVSLELARAQTKILLGLSGSGKSTLIRLIIGLIAPDSGRILIDGTDMSTIEPEKRARMVGYVPQSGALFPHLTARENVCLVAQLEKRPRDWIEARLIELSQTVSLDLSLFDRYPSQLSGGQRQRVALVRALFLEPHLLILDEPLGALDPIVRYEIQKELKEIFTKVRATVLLVTHDLREARYLGDDFSVLYEGRIIQSGSYDDLSRRPANPFVRLYLESQEAHQ